MDSRAMHKFAVFLVALIACHLVLSVQAGREIKSVSKNDSKQTSQTDNSAMHKEDHDAAHHSVSGKKEVFPPPTTPTKTSDFGYSVERHEDDFRPTTPGNSPGVGHSFAEDEEDVEQKPGSISSSNGMHSIAGTKEDFRPTNPGHSPGVGHSFVTKKAEPNA
ncbi:hypothetical protein REPUB_Repub10bG0147700 [Reevesia pubescens]